MLTCFRAFSVENMQSGYEGVFGGADDESDINFVKFHIPEGTQLFLAFCVLIMAKWINRGSWGIQMMNLKLIL